MTETNKTYDANDTSLWLQNFRSTHFLTLSWTALQWLHHAGAHLDKQVDAALRPEKLQVVRHAA